MEGTNVCKVWHFECSKSMTFAPRVHPLQSSSINSMLGFTAVAMTGKRMGLPSGVQICESENERKDSTSNTCILHPRENFIGGAGPPFLWYKMGFLYKMGGLVKVREGVFLQNAWPPCWSKNLSLQKGGTNVSKSCIKEAGTCIL